MTQEPEGARHRRIAEWVTENLMNDKQLGQDITSGRLDADFIMPLLAGIYLQATESMFLPTVGGTFSGFDPEVRPMEAVVTLLDGSKIKVTLEALDG